MGVNITFFPMHFLGLAGMPRRIPDYPDAYIDYNSITDFGSQLSVIGVIIFLFLVFYTLITENVYLNTTIGFNIKQQYKGITIIPFGG